MRQADKSDIARMLAQRFLVIQDGPMHDPATWLRVAARRGHEVGAWHQPGGSAGEYLSAEAGTGVVNFNTAYSPVLQAKALVHELAHAEMNVLASGMHRGEVPGWLAGEYALYSSTGDCCQVRHEIAQIVVLLCFGEASRTYGRTV